MTCNLQSKAMEESLKKGGLRPVLIEALNVANDGTKEGKLDVVTDGVMQLSGRPASNFGDWARRHAAAFR